MKYLGLTSFWICSLALTFLLVSVNLTEADPTDDFSFSLGSPERAESYQLISEHRMAEILADRLDLFPKSQIPRLSKHILSLCREHRFDPAFILSLIEVESRFQIKATSPCGALGLMQLMIPTAKFVVQQLKFRLSGHENFDGRILQYRGVSAKMLLDPYMNTAIGITYLAWLRDYYHGLSPFHVFAAYNIGPARMDELLSQKSFQPIETKKYFLAIKRGVPTFRYYRRKSVHPRPATRL
jgi:soluble lytic murein transglycosylase-like protein